MPNISPEGLIRDPKVACLLILPNPESLRLRHRIWRGTEERILRKRLIVRLNIPIDISRKEIRYPGGQPTISSAFAHEDPGRSALLLPSRSQPLWIRPIEKRINEGEIFDFFGGRVIGNSHQRLEDISRPIPYG